MTQDDRRDLVLIGASLLGVTVGAILNDGETTDKRRAEGETPGAAAGRATGRTPLVSAPALFTASQISRRLGEEAGLPEDRLWAQALLAFLVGALLTYFADGLRRFVPGLRGG